MNALEKIGSGIAAGSYPDLALHVEDRGIPRQIDPVEDGVGLPSAYIRVFRQRSRNEGLGATHPLG